MELELILKIVLRRLATLSAIVSILLYILKQKARTWRYVSIDRYICPFIFILVFSPWFSLFGGFIFEWMSL